MSHFLSVPLTSEFLMVGQKNESGFLEYVWENGMALFYFGLFVCLPRRCAFFFFFEGICINNSHKNKMEATVFSNTVLWKEGGEELPLFLTQDLDVLCDC